MENPKKCVVCRFRVAQEGSDVCEMCKQESSPEFIAYMRELENNG